MINKRLFEHYGIDTTKDLGVPVVCAKPWETLLIDKRGSCFACECTAWLPQSVGNLQVNTLSEILRSDVRAHLQDSVSDGSYRYCNEHQCPYIKARDWNPMRPERGLRFLRLAIDESCNLRCPSCRDQLVFHKEGAAYRLGLRLADRVNEWLAQHHEHIQVHIGSDGDPFASHVYRHFMEHTPNRDNIKYSILTNGLMFREFHTRVPQVMRNLEVLGVSMDGATRDTYERLRLGGTWHKIMDNLQCIRDMQRRFRFDMHMVVQEANWREMIMMRDLARDMGADRVYFNRVQDWNTRLDVTSQTFHTLAEFDSMRIELTSDPLCHTAGLL